MARIRRGNKGVGNAVNNDIPSQSTQVRNFQILDKPFKRKYIIELAFGKKNTNPVKLIKTVEKAVNSNVAEGYASYLKTLIHLGSILQTSYETLQDERRLVNIEEIKKFAYITSHLAIANKTMIKKNMGVTDKTFLDWSIVLRDLITALDIHVRDVIAWYSLDFMTSYQEVSPKKGSENEDV